MANEVSYSVTGCASAWHLGLCLMLPLEKREVEIVWNDDGKKRGTRFRIMSMKLVSDGIPDWFDVEGFRVDTGTEFTARLNVATRSGTITFSTPMIVIVGPDKGYGFFEKFEQAGFEVWSFESGAEAVAFITRRKPDIILLNPHVPRISAPDMVRLIRNSENVAMKNLPIVLRGEHPDTNELPNVERIESNNWHEVVPFVRQVLQRSGVI